MCNNKHNMLIGHSSSNGEFIIEPTIMLFSQYISVSFYLMVD